MNDFPCCETPGGHAPATPAPPVFQELVRRSDQEILAKICEIQREVTENDPRIEILYWVLNPDS